MKPNNPVKNPTQLRNTTPLKSTIRPPIRRLGDASSNQTVAKTNVANSPARLWNYNRRPATPAKSPATAFKAQVNTAKLPSKLPLTHEQRVQPTTGKPPPAICPSMSPSVCRNQPTISKFYPSSGTNQSSSRPSPLLLNPARTPGSKNPFAKVADGNPLPLKQKAENENLARFAEDDCTVVIEDFPDLPAAQTAPPLPATPAQAAEAPVQTNGEIQGTSTEARIETAPTNCVRGAKQEDYLSLLNRYTVLESSNTSEGMQLRLVVEPLFQGGPLKRVCMLRDSWVRTCVQVGDIVHIHAKWYSMPDENDEDIQLAIIDCKEGLIVVNPDVLVSSTSIVNSIVCQRRAVLSERFKTSDLSNQLMIVGTVGHQLFQKALKEKIYDAEALRRTTDDLLADPLILQKLYSGSLSVEHVKGDVEQFIPVIRSFVENHVEAKDGGSQTPGTWDGHIEAVCDIEETVWSPRLGVKGKVDMSVRVNGSKVPLELKTGRSNFSLEHTGQVMLYSMMMSECSASSSSNGPGGLLLYLSDGAVKSVTPKVREQQDLVQIRNELAHFLSAKTTSNDDGTLVREGPLPPVLDRPTLCASCPLRTECTIYKMEESTDAVPTNEEPSFLAHLSPSHRQYFVHWSRMLRLEWEEGQSQANSLSDLWCLSAAERQERGSCFSCLEIQDCRASQQKTSNLSHFAVTFVPSRPAGAMDGVGEWPLPRTDLKVGDNVVLSTCDRTVLATGSIVCLDRTSVTVATDRDVNHLTDGIVVLDKFEYQGGQSRLFTNLSWLMTNNPRAQHLRRLIVDLERPRFRLGLSDLMTDRILSPAGRSIMKPLNRLQQRAVLQALVSRDYCLIEGLPGTGKTSLIVALIRLAVLCDLTVLLGSFTHSAVDNVLAKLVEAGFENFIRLGRAFRIHPSILPYCAEVNSLKCQSVSEVEKLYNVPVVASTCLVTNHPAIARRPPFDICIVDEAAQVLQPAILGLLAAAKRFVLVGDPRQLPPIVGSKTAKRMGMGESLFQRLSFACPTGEIIRLRQQYRMCGPLNILANKLTYECDLVCADPQVEKATVRLPRILQNVMPKWLSRIVQPSLAHSVNFLDTSMLSRDPEGNGLVKNRECVNLLEAMIAQRIALVLHHCGMDNDLVGIIAPYQAQVQLLKKLVKEKPIGTVEINTVDQYQGRDKSVIIYSCVKSQGSAEPSSEELESPTIMHDLRRLTVAVTRAKHKLVIVGHGATLKRYPPFARLLDSLEPHQHYQLAVGKDGYVETSLNRSLLE